MPHVLVPLAKGCEELEAVTIIDLLRRAEIEVTVAGLEPGPVKASRGTVILPDTTLDKLPQNTFDMIVLPGGLPGADHLASNSTLIQLIKAHAETGKYTAAICAAPKVLAVADLLKQRRVTGFPGVLEALQLKDTEITNNPVEIDHNIITSRGPGTAMDFALTLIEKLCGEEKRKAVEAPLQRPASTTIQ